jgi:hypothetical protein
MGRSLGGESDRPAGSYPGALRRLGIPEFTKDNLDVKDIWTVLGSHNRPRRDPNQGDLCFRGADRSLHSTIPHRALVSMLRDLGGQQVGACRVLDLRCQCPASSTELILRAARRGMRPAFLRAARRGMRPAFPSRNVARGTRHVPPTPRPIACSHGSPRRRSALAKWDEAEASEHNQNTMRPGTITADSRTMSRAGEPRGKSSDAPYYRTPPDSFPVPRPYLASCELRRQFGRVAEAPAVTTCGSSIVCPAGIRAGKRCSFTT